MKRFKKIVLSISLAFAAFFSAFAIPTQTVSAATVNYEYAGKYIVNWGTKDELSTFLSPNAESFYTSGYTYSTVSKLSGSSEKNSVPSSALYKKLQTLMKDRHKTLTSYKGTRDLYKYTDCEKNNESTVISFYSLTRMDSEWNSAKVWDREHTWPNSKCINSDGQANDSADIMMLRPTLCQENRNRGNDAYGESESSGFFDPQSEGGITVRGDCARSMLYGYVRWGNTGKMWGASGVMESVEILLKWMEEDPVDTWEMGRNDSVESITGTRNVFVDYPEYAWLLFGESIPQNMSTPSGMAKNQGGGNQDSSGGASGSGSSSTTHTHSFGDWTVTKPATATEDGKMQRECKGCNYVETQTIPKTGNNSSGNSSGSNNSSGDGNHNFDEPCSHEFGEWKIIKEATETDTGLKMHTCTKCNYPVVEVIPALNAAEGGCASSIVASTSVLGVLALIACGIVVKKSKKED